MKQFNFEALSELYKEDPMKFAIISKQMIDEYIESIPNEVSRNKCKGIQFKIEHDLSKYKDPLARLNKMVEIFWSGVYDFNNALNGTAEDITTLPKCSVTTLSEYKKSYKDKK